jgi:hypothetical protein
MNINWGLVSLLISGDISVNEPSNKPPINTMRLNIQNGFLFILPLKEKRNHTHFLSFALSVCSMRYQLYNKTRDEITLCCNSIVGAGLVPAPTIDTSRLIKRGCSKTEQPPNLQLIFIPLTPQGRGMKILN